jgi:hypothetical protein
MPQGNPFNEAAAALITAAARIHMNDPQADPGSTGMSRRTGAHLFRMPLPSSRSVRI